MVGDRETLARLVGAGWRRRDFGALWLKGDGERSVSLLTQEEIAERDQPRLAALEMKELPSAIVSPAASVGSVLPNL